MKEIIIKSERKKEVIDITEQIEELIQKENQIEGLVFLFVKHTTCALTTADLDSGTDLDMLDAFEKMVPKLNYRHPHNPEHVLDHILSSLIGTSLLLPFANKKLILGDWQRVVLIELNGPRARKIVFKIL